MHVSQLFAACNGTVSISGLFGIPFRWRVFLFDFLRPCIAASCFGVPSEGDSYPDRCRRVNSYISGSVQFAQYKSTSYMLCFDFGAPRSHILYRCPGHIPRSVQSSQSLLGNKEFLEVSSMKALSRVDTTVTEL